MTFLALTLVSGGLAGAFLGTINLALVEPSIDKAVGYEVQRDILSGQRVDPIELGQYRDWQKSGEVISAIILGISLAALFAIVFAYSRKSLPFSSHIKKALVLAGTMWFVLFFITALKYPPNPPGVGSSDTLFYRQFLFVSFVLISGAGALGSFLLHRKVSNNQSLLQSKLVIPVIYSGIIICAYIGLPNNPDSVPQSLTYLVLNFRIASVFTLAMYWVALGVIFGVLWEKFKPHQERSDRITTL